MSKDDSFILSWQLLDRLFRTPLETDFIREIITLPLAHMVAREELEKLMEILTQWLETHQLREEAQQAFQRLFIGPGVPPAPPWGSVYLTEDNTILGPSTIATRKKFERLGLRHYSQGWEPDDHFSRCCAFLSLLAQEDNPAPANDFLEQDFLTWAPRFLELLKETCQDPVYQSIADYALAVLAHAGKDLTPAEVKLYL